MTDGLRTIALAELEQRTAAATEAEAKGRASAAQVARTVNLWRAIAFWFGAKEYNAAYLWADERGGNFLLMTELHRACRVARQKLDSLESKVHGNHDPDATCIDLGLRERDLRRLFLAGLETIKADRALAFMAPGRELARIETQIEQLLRPSREKRRHAA